MFVKELLTRAIVHDDSKFGPDEFPIYASAIEEFEKHPFGTPGYQKAKDSISKATKHHYAHNSHHLEFFRQDEEWKPVVGFEKSYVVSNYGEVKSIDRIITRNNGKLLTKHGKVITQYVTPKGYCRVQLQENGRTSNLMVHDIVANAFLLNPNNKPVVNHKDGNKKNNYVTNLEWVTHSENLLHAYENKLKIPNLKYVVTCNELDITTLGTKKMEAELKSRGYSHASSAGIYRCIQNPSAKHLDLSFTATNFEKWMVSPINDIDLVDLIEMLSDWKAATLNNSNHPGDIYKSIDEMCKKYYIDDQIKNILLNTAKNYHL